MTDSKTPTTAEIADTLSDGDDSDNNTSTDASADDHTVTPSAAETEHMPALLPPTEAAHDTSLPAYATLRRQFHLEFGGVSPIGDVSIDEGEIHRDTVYAPRGLAVWFPDHAYNHFSFTAEDFDPIDDWTLDTGSLDTDPGQHSDQQTIYVFDAGDHRYAVWSEQIESAAAFAGVAPHDVLPHVEINTTGENDTHDPTPVRIPLRAGTLYVLPVTYEPGEINV